MPQRCRVSACTLPIIVSKEIIRRSSHKSVRYRQLGDYDFSRSFNSDSDCRNIGYDSDFVITFVNESDSAITDSDCDNVASNDYFLIQLAIERVIYSG